MCEEKEVVHELAGLGELREPWHSVQMSWLDHSLALINTYNTQTENLDNYRGESHPSRPPCPLSCPHPVICCRYPVTRY